MDKELKTVNTASSDITAENIEKLKELFPEILTEKKIDFEKLRLILGDEVDDSPERYNFTWNGKKQAMKLAQQPTTATLKPNKEKSKNWDDTKNIYIEGDNLEVLKLLQKSYSNRIKMIYIDPPYNTGKDFVYKDNFHDSIKNYLEQTGQIDSDGNRMSVNVETSGRYHTDWLNMMYPRLKLARNLLTEDGVIFISIDDNEQSNLIKICDEIFGENNKIGPIIQNKKNSKNDTLDVQRNHEFIVIYRKGAKYLDGTKEKSTLENEVVKLRDLLEEDGEFYYLNDPITTRGMGGTLQARPNLGYTVYFHPETKEKIAISDYDREKIENSNDEDEVYETDIEMLEKGYVPIRPPKVRGKLGAFTWDIDKFNSEKKNIVITGKLGKYVVRKRTFVPKKEVKFIDGKPFFEQKLKSNSRSIIDFSTNEGSNTLTDLFGESGIFDNPKNVGMIEYLLSLVVNDENAIVLDFFSGSATSAEAVLRLNAQDGKNRRYILAQLPEKIEKNADAFKLGYRTICAIGEDRIYRFGNKILEEKPGLKNKLDVGFKVFELSNSNIKKWDSETMDLNEQIEMQLQNIYSDTNNFDLVYEIMLKQGLDLSLPIEETKMNDATIYKIYKIAYGTLFIVLGTKITVDSATEIIKIVKSSKLEKVSIVFQDTGFANDNEKLNAIEILNAGGIKYDNILSV
ncbi:site-specific DNA-methyltransferase [Enterococcus nangangensis]